MFLRNGTGKVDLVSKNQEGNLGKLFNAEETLPQLVQNRTLNKIRQVQPLTRRVWHDPECLQGKRCQQRQGNNPSINDEPARGHQDHKW